MENVIPINTLEDFDKDHKPVKKGGRFTFSEKSLVWVGIMSLIIIAGALIPTSNDSRMDSAIKAVVGFVNAIMAILIYKLGGVTE